MGWFDIAVTMRHTHVSTRVVTVAADDLDHALTRAVQLLERDGQVELLDIKGSERATD